MVESLPSNFFFFKRHVYCVKYLLRSKNFNYSSEKQILKNENILTATLNISAKNKRIQSPVSMCLSLLKYFNLEMLPHRGFWQSISHSVSLLWPWVPQIPVSFVVGHSRNSWQHFSCPPEVETLKEGDLTNRNSETMKWLKSKLYATT